MGQTEIHELGCVKVPDVTVRIRTMRDINSFNGGLICLFHLILDYSYL